MNPIDIKPENLRFGFELECQAMENLTKHDKVIPDPMTEEQYKEVLEKIWKGLLVTRWADVPPAYTNLNFPKYLSEDSCPSLVECLERQVKIINNLDVSATVYWDLHGALLRWSLDPEGTVVKMNTLLELFGNLTFEYMLEFEKQRARKEEGIKNEIRNNNPIESFSQRLSAFDFLKKKVDCPAIVVGTDGTVEGFEVRANGPKKWEDCQEAIDILFSYAYKINEFCSFHVHVSASNVKEMAHVAEMQLLMIQYLLDHWEDIPAGNKTRWKEKNWRSRYYAIAEDADKYRFVAFRGKTWEFRCFGNIDNAIDAKRCVDLAASAFLWAYNNLDNPDIHVKSPGALERQLGTLLGGQPEEQPSKRLLAMRRGRS